MPPPALRFFRPPFPARLLGGLVLLAATANAAEPPLVELRAGGRIFQGRLYARDAERALLLARDGRLQEVPLAGVTGFGVADPRFRPFGAAELRDGLRREFGRGMEVVATPRFVVAGRPAAARATTRELEEVYAGYRWFCSTRHLPLADAEFPLVAVVHPDRASFDAGCVADGVPPAGGLRGYYGELTNRFVTYETRSISGELSADLRDTLVHETIHQLAFNTGLHTRRGSDPVWVVEGLATTLEPEPMRRAVRSGSSPAERINPERLARYLATPRKGWLAALVAREETFTASRLDGYALAWATTFYLVETRSSDYGRYLTRLAARPPLTADPPADRLADFTAVFGGDFTMLETQIDRFLRRTTSR